MHHVSHATSINTLLLCRYRWGGICSDATELFCRLRFHILKGGVDGVEVWLKGEGGVAHLLAVNSTIKENLSKRTLTEFPQLHVLSKGAGPPTIGKGVGHPGTIGSPSVTQETSERDRIASGEAVSEEAVSQDIVPRPPGYICDNGGNGNIMPGPPDHSCSGGGSGNIVPGPPDNMCDSKWSEEELDGGKDLESGVSASLRLIASAYSASDSDD